MAAIEDLQNQAILNKLIQDEEFNLFAMLKSKVTIDGNKYCVYYGENLQEGITGYGDSIYLAILDFNRQFYEKIPEKK